MKRRDPIDEIVTEMAEGPEELTKPAKQPIKFLTYNFYLRPPLVYSNQGDHKDARLDYFIKHYLDKYDVIAF